MWRINVYFLNLFMIHWVTFGCSPIDKKRFELEHQARILNGGRSQTFREPKENWYWALRHPIQVCSLIKRYHITGNTFLVFMVLQLILLIHFTLKTLVYTLYCGTDQSRIDYLSSIYYTNLARNTPQPILFNNLFMTQACLLLCIRFRAFYRLIKLSLLNADHYHHVHIGQVNLANMSLFFMTPRQWIQIWCWTIEHERQVTQDAELSDKHHCYAHYHVDSMHFRDAMYHFDPLDFSECYSAAGFHEMPTERPEFDSWHKAGIFPRIGTNTLRFTSVLTLIGNASLVTSLVLYNLVFFYLETQSEITSWLNPSLPEIYSVLRIHLSEPKHLLRLLELFLWSMVQITSQYDGAMIFTDIQIVNSRANKMINIFRKKLDLCRQSTHQARDSNNRGLNQIQLQVINRKCNHSSRINEDIRELVRLSNLLYYEFNDVKREHSSLLNILVIGSSLCLSYAISLFANCGSIPEFFALFIAVVSGITPCLSALIFGAITESKLRTIHRLMSNLLINEANLLENRTIALLRRGSRVFEIKEHRSFSVLGMHSLGPGSAITFFTYLATAIVYMNRFNRR